MKTLYRNSPQGQSKSVISKFFGGLNSYNSAGVIGDTFLSDAYNVIPRKDESLNIGMAGTQTDQSTGSGKILAALADRDNVSDSQINFYLITQITGTSATGYWDNFVFTYNALNVNTTSIAAYQFSGKVDDACIFNTEADAHYCFISHLSKKLLTYARNDAQVKVYDLPFYPKKMVAHASRIFMIDTFNKVWWSKAGDISSWYGYEEDDDYLVTSTAMKNGAFTIAAQPTSPRVATVTCTTADTADTRGILTLVGKASDGVTDQTEVATLKAGKIVLMKIFSSFTSITQSGWTTSGANDTIMVGIGASGMGYVVDDAGFWTLPQENHLNGLAVMSNVLYIFAENNIYALSGYSPDTFVLEKAISGIGCPPPSTTELFGQNVRVCNNRAYFVFENDLYEFSGDKYPEVISRPISAYGKVLNNVGGGIPSVPASIDSENDYIYLFSSATVTPANSLYMLHTYYMFDIEHRSWWKNSGILVERDTANEANWLAGAWMNVFYTGDYAQASNAYEKNKAWAFYSYAKDATSNATWCISQDTGYSQMVSPYLVTKAFNEGVTDDLTLTNLILHLKSGDAPFDYTDGVMVNVYYSKTEAEDDFVLLATIPGVDINADPTAHVINLAGSEIARTHHYRLKIEVVNAAELLLYAIERRFRVIGRSR